MCDLRSDFWIWDQMTCNLDLIKFLPWSIICRLYLRFYIPWSVVLLIYASLAVHTLQDRCTVISIRFSDTGSHPNSPVRPGPGMGVIWKPMPAFLSAVLFFLLTFWVGLFSIYSWISAIVQVWWRIPADFSKSANSQIEVSWGTRAVELAIRWIAPVNFRLLSSGAIFEIVILSFNWSRNVVLYFLCFAEVEICCLCFLYKFA